MAICAKCGVELGEDVARCPLCGTVVAGREAEAATAAHESGKHAKADKRPRHAVEILSVLAGLAAVLCVLINLKANGGQVNWSLYAVIGIAMAWLLAAMPIILRRVPWVLFGAVGGGELLLLFVLNVVDLALGNKDWWILDYGLPIYLASLILIAGAAILIVIFKMKGLNCAGVILAAATLECIALESILSHAIGGRIVLDWSPIVALVCAPLSVLAFYFHYRFIKKPLHRKLHF
jgi:hypothetical protein